MSTKIYNAFISKRPVKSAHALLKISLAIRDQLRPASVSAYHDTWAMYLLHGMDKAIAKGEHPSVAYKVARESEDEARRNDRKGLREPLWDVNAEWSLIPLKNGHALIMMYAERPILSKWKWKHFWRDFHFQNQTDRDEGITDAEWRHREKMWDDVLGHEAPCSCSFGMKLWGSYSGPHLDLNKVFARQQKLITRCDSLARRLVMDEFYAKRKASDTEGIMATVRSFEEWEKSDDGKERTRLESSRLLLKLPKRLTREMLKTP